MSRKSKGKRKPSPTRAGTKNLKAAPREKRLYAPAGYEAAKAPPKPKAPSRAKGATAKDLEKAREIRAKRDRIDRDVTQRPKEQRSSYLKRRAKAKSETPRGAPPPPKGSPYRNNATYQRRRGYFYRDAGGRWRTPDGRVAKGQRKVTIQRKDEKGRLVKEERYHFQKAYKHNDKNRAKLVREDAYLSLLSHGANVSRSRFNRIAGKADDRESVEDRVRKAYERGDLSRKPSRKVIRDDIDHSLPDRDATVSIEMGNESREISREGAGYVDEEGNHITQSELEDIWEKEFYGDFDYDDWYDDYDSDAGDTP